MSKMTTTTMYRKTTCVRCGYVLETFTSYYRNNKAWKAGHNLQECRKELKMSEGIASLELSKKG